MSGAFETADALSDAFLSLGASAALCVVYQLVFACAPKNKWLNCAAHAAFFAPVGVLAFCFVAGATAAREPRWYILAGAAAGAYLYVKCFANTVARALAKMRALARRLLSPVSRALGRAAGGLQKRLERVYNRAAERRAKRAKTREADDGGDGERAELKKRAHRAYTQT